MLSDPQHKLVMLSQECTECSCGKGIEAPEVAQQWMSSGHYTVAPPQDIWALGLLLNKASGGQPPLEHLEAIRQTQVNQDFKAAVHLEEDQRDLEDLQYLANLLTSGGSYATNVSACCVQVVVQLHLQWW